MSRYNSNCATSYCRLLRSVFPVALPGDILCILCTSANISLYFVQAKQTGTFQAQRGATVRNIIATRSYVSTLQEYTRILNDSSIIQANICWTMCCQTNNRCTSTIAASKTHQILDKSPAVASLLHVPAVPGVAAAAPLRDKGDHRCEPPPKVKNQTSLSLQKSRTTLKQTIRFCLIWITAPGGLLRGTSTYRASFPGAAPIGYHFSMTYQKAEYLGVHMTI